MEAAERLTSRDHNNFNLLRLCAAIGVVVTHSYALLGYPERDFLNRLTHGLVSFSQLGLYSFFVISGFLVYASLTRSSSVASFFSRRALRIFPALCTVIVLTVFILGPLATNLSLGAYATHPDTYRYLEGMLLYKFHYTLPGVFTQNPYPDAVNGSLWTLPHEWTCYVVLAGAYGLLKRYPRLMLAGATLGALAIRTLVGRYRVEQIIPFLNLDVRQLMLFGALFILGALAFELRATLPLKGWVALSLSIIV